MFVKLFTPLVQLLTNLSLQQLLNIVSSKRPFPFLSFPHLTSGIIISEKLNINIEMHKALDYANCPSMLPHTLGNCGYARVPQGYLTPNVSLRCYHKHCSQLCKPDEVQRFQLQVFVTLHQGANLIMFCATVYS